MKVISNETLRMLLRNIPIVLNGVPKEECNRDVRLANAMQNLLRAVRLLNGSKDYKDVKDNNDLTAKEAEKWL